ncbi:MAG: hypothetical protein ACHQ01_09180 [Candidatus Limnocylindrales bacterium]
MATIPPVGIAERLYGRPASAKIFVSSKMRGDALSAEREAAIGAIRSIRPLAEPWAWETSGLPGPYSAAAVCVGHARTSDGLVLLVGDSLTAITRREYRAAKGAGAACFVLTRSADTPDGRTAAFVARERKTVVTHGFANCRELRTLVRRSIIEYAIRAWRLDSLRRSGPRPGTAP